MVHLSREAQNAPYLLIVRFSQFLPEHHGLQLLYTFRNWFWYDTIYSGILTNEPLKSFESKHYFIKAFDVKLLYLRSEHECANAVKTL